MGGRSGSTAAADPGGKESSIGGVTGVTCGWGAPWGGAAVRGETPWGVTELPENPHCHRVQAKYPDGQPAAGFVRPHLAG